MCRHAEVQYAPTIMGQHQEHKEQAEGRRGDNEEVRGNQLMHVIPEEGLPGLGGRSTRTNQVLCHGGFTDIDAELEQFAMDARCTPTGIGQAHLSDEIANFASCTWSTPRTKNLTEGSRTNFDIAGTSFSYTRLSNQRILAELAKLRCSPYFVKIERSWFSLNIAQHFEENYVGRSAWS